MSFVITGSVAYDYLMRYPGLYRDHILPDQLDKISLSFLAESMRKERGGVAANIAYTMKLLGADPIVFATVGQDFGDYRRWMEENGLRTDHIVEIPDEFTASFFVGSDQEQNQIAIFYTGAMAHARNYSLEQRGLSDAQIVLISPNDPGAMLHYAQECRRLGIPYAYDPSQQTRPAERRRTGREHSRRHLSALVMSMRSAWCRRRPAGASTTSARQGEHSCDDTGQGWQRDLR